MAFSISVKNDIKKATKFLNNLQKKQLPYATSLALKNTIEDCQKALIKEAETVFNNKKPWYRPTQPTGIKRRYSKKTEWPNMSATVYCNAPFIRLQVEGGIKRPTRSKNLLIPTANTAAGNRNAKGPEKLLKQKRVISNKSGIFKLTGSKKNPVIKKHFTRAPSAQIKKRFRFNETAARIAKLKFKPNFMSALNRALATAK